MPKFSIIIPTHNRSHLLQRAIASVLNQTYSDFELIIINDGSDDDTANLLANYVTHEVKLKYQSNQQPKGAAAARNAGILLANGEYICFLDDDDAYMPEFLQEVFTCLQNTQQEIGFIWCGVRKIFESDDSPSKISEKIWDIASITDQKLEFAVEFAASHGFVAKRSLLCKVGLFDTHLRTLEDIDLLFSLLETNAAYKAIPKVLVTIYIHRHISLSRSKKFAVQAQDNERFLNKHSEFLMQHPRLWLHYHDSWLGFLYKSGQKKAARSVLKKMFFKNPLYLSGLEKWLRFEVLRRIWPKK